MSLGILNQIFLSETILKIGLMYLQASEIDKSRNIKSRKSPRIAEPAKRPVAESF